MDNKNLHECIARDCEDILSTLDLLDLDEEIIDKTIKTIIKKKDVSSRQLKVMLNLLNYKHMIGVKEETDCDNDFIVEFTLNRLMHLSVTEMQYNDTKSSCESQVTLLLNIFSIALQLDKEKISHFCQHIFQQLVHQLNVKHNTFCNSDLTQNLIYLKIIDTLFTVCIHTKYQPQLMFLFKEEIIKLLYMNEKTINFHIYSYTIPNFIRCFHDFTILDNIYNNVISKGNNVSYDDMFSLCALSDFYFPNENSELTNQIKSLIVHEIEYWKLIQFGLFHIDDSVKKCSNYLSKRTIDYVLKTNENIYVVQENENEPFFIYHKDNRAVFESVFSEFFVMLETLEEKQFHLVDPALNLIERFTSFHKSWNYCLLKRALMHESNLVIKKVLLIALKTDVPSMYSKYFPYIQVVSALNRISIYDNFFSNIENNPIILELQRFINKDVNFSNLLKYITVDSFSPMPRFFVSLILKKNNMNKKTVELIDRVLNSFFGETGYRTNNLFIESGTQCCLFDFCISNLNDLTFNNLLQLFSTFVDCSLYRFCTRWESLKAIIKHSNNQVIQQVLTMIHADSLEYTANRRELAKMVILFIDADLLSKTNLINLLQFKLNLLKDSDKRTYASVCIFDESFLLIIDFLQITKSCNGYDKRLSVKQENKLYNECILLIEENFDSILHYILLKLSSTNEYEKSKFFDQIIDGIRSLFSEKLLACKLINNLQFILNNAVVLLEKSTHDYKKYFIIKILAMLLLNLNKSESFQDVRMISKEENYSQIITLLLKYENSNNNKNGELFSTYNEAVCEIFYYYCKYTADIPSNIISKFCHYISDLLEKGGNLFWITKMFRSLIRFIVKYKFWDECQQLLHTMWKEILQIRKNEKFRGCIKNIVKSVFTEPLLMSIEIHEIVMEFGGKILEVGESAPYLVYLMIKQINKKLKLCYLNSIIPILCETIIFGDILRKDQRIEYDICNFINSDILANELSQSSKYVINPANEIRLFTLEILIYQNKTLLLNIKEYLKGKITSLCKLKQPYHICSSTHRELIRSLQCLLYMCKLFPENLFANDIIWCLEALTDQPHHMSVKILLEWIIILYLITHKDLQKSAEDLKLLRVPCISYCTIIYHVVKHQIFSIQDDVSNVKYVNENVWKNLDFVMQSILPLTMGQQFSIRLHSQYLILKLLSMIHDDQRIKKYKCILDIIKSNFQICSNEKHLKCLQEDFYVNNFDPIHYLNVKSLYYYIPSHYGVVKEEWIPQESCDELQKKLDSHIEPSLQYFVSHSNENIQTYDIFHSKASEDICQVLDNTANSEFSDISKSIQKKFVPWKNMLHDLGIVGKLDKTNESNLIVVASLIDRIPNLGGLARTCEVLGVKQLVISSLKYLQNAQFQNLSVSSEKWIDVIEIQPGIKFKKYLSEMKSKGYKIVGAEQTSSSTSLQQFRFPKNTLLLLGHEKEGISPDLLSVIDHYVEIPQQGLIRSLNVHVTASIFIWEYTKQHLLQES